MSNCLVYTSAMSDNYAEETGLLFKLLRTPAFRFVIVSFNHYDLVHRLESDLCSRYPARAVARVDCEKDTYQDIRARFDALSDGFLFFHNFQSVLSEQRNTQGAETPAFAEENLRRRHITAGLNLHRDYWATRPVAFIVFVRPYSEALPLRTIMEKMPDLWSFRSLILELKMEYREDKDILSMSDRLEFQTVSALDTQQQQELNRLLDRLERTPQEEVAFRLTLYPLIVDLLKEGGNYQKALRIVQIWEIDLPENERVEVWRIKGELLLRSGRMSDALTCFEAVARFYEQASQGDPQNAGISNNLAISYQFLGKIHSELGNLASALAYYEQFHQLLKELCEAYPQNVDYKRGLAISCQFLGKIHADPGDLAHALAYYEQSHRLFKELHEAYPQNPKYKNGLAISCRNLGNTHEALGNLPQALADQEKSHQLSKELYEAYPQNKGYKNGLAISYRFLGKMHKVMGDLPQALAYHELSHQLLTELHEAYPQSADFKYNMARSYAQLGLFHEQSMLNLEKATYFYSKSLKILQEMAEIIPIYAELKKWVEDAIARTGKSPEPA